MIFHISEIEWDYDPVDDEGNPVDPPDLPNEFDIDVEDTDDEEELVDRLSDAVTDKHGFCHKGFTYGVKYA